MWSVDLPEEGRMTLKQTAWIGAFAAALASSAAAAPAGPAAAVTATPQRLLTIADFTLPDQTGKAHHLYGLTNAKVIVLVTQGDSCPIVRNISNTLKALQAKYEPMGVTFMMLNPNQQDSPADVVQEAKDWGYAMPILMDAKQTVGEALHVERTAEVFVINPKTWQIIYHGPVDDRVTYERQKAVADNPWATQAIDAVLAGKTVAVAQRDSQGCLINFPNRTARTAGGLARTNG
jgi:peroxiredoxin